MDGNFWLFEGGEPEPYPSPEYPRPLVWAENNDGSCTRMSGVSEFLEEIIPPGTAVEIIFGKRKKL